MWLKYMQHNYYLDTNGAEIRRFSCQQLMFANEETIVEDEHHKIALKGKLQVALITILI